MPLDPVALTLFLASVFAGGMVTGMAGFAMGLVVSGVWLHLLTPTQTTALIVGYGLFVHAHGVWTFRKAIDTRRAIPLIAGSALGVPLGIMLLTQLDPVLLRRAVGVLLVLYSAYGLLRPGLAPLRAGVVADGVIGMANGVLGGMTGLAGPIAVIWCQLTGVPRQAQRAIFQPMILAAFVMTALGLALDGAIDRDLLILFGLGTVPLAAGIWLGVRLYGRLDENLFRALVLVLLLLSGLVLLSPWP